jgi:PAS domain-containing protein
MREPLIIWVSRKIILSGFGADTRADWDFNLAFLHPDDTRRNRQSPVGMFTHRLRRSAEFSRAEGPKEGTRWFVGCSEPVRAADGTLLYWIGIDLEIEELKHAEFYLRRSEA